MTIYMQFEPTIKWEIIMNFFPTTFIFFIEMLEIENLK
jgi:hypothetical protein